MSITAQGHTDILRYLLDNLENKDDVNVLDHIHATPAHDAAEYGQMQSMLLLLRNGADISIKDTVKALLYKCMHNYYACIQFLHGRRVRLLMNLLWNRTIQMWQL